ncbi:hypothetical protein FOA52_008114 [Chlamydomonas sp. UWO 241]|nr:hypothetical protein FOA52_008114 [Chlamydomonas sp. UWO 241]
MDDGEEGEIAGMEEGELDGARVAPARHGAADPEDNGLAGLAAARKKRKEKKGKKGAKAVASAIGGGGGGAEGAQPSSGFVDDVYAGARAGVEIKAEGPIRLVQVQDLVRWTLTTDAVSPSWVFLKNKPLVKQLVLVVAHGLSADLFERKAHLMPHLSALGRPAHVQAQNAHVWPGQTVGAFLNVNLGGKKRKAAQQQQQDAERGRGGGRGGRGGDANGSGGRGGGDSVGGPSASSSAPHPSHQLPPFPPSHYCLTLREMESVKYPLPTLEPASGATVVPPGFIATRSAASPAATAAIAATAATAATAAAAGNDSAGGAGCGGGAGGAGGRGGGGSGGEGNDIDGDGEAGAPPPPLPPPPPEEQQQLSDGDGEAGDGRAHKRRKVGGSSPRGVAADAAPAAAAAAAAGAAAAAAAAAAAPVAAAAGGSGPHGAAAAPLRDARPTHGLPCGASTRLADPERMVGCDCEMVITAHGFELARLTLVDGQGAVLMDEFVLPTNEVTDYNTRYSGIEAKTLAGCTLTLEGARQRFCGLVSAETLLVGHSLENDLNCLKVVHSRILDTALLYPHPKGPPFRSALKVLCQKYLRRKIQDGSHDSIIDARCAMDLAWLKIRHGPSYGTPEHENANVGKLVDALGEHKHRCVLVDRKETLSRYATGSASAIPVSSDGDAVEAVSREASRGTAGFVWTQLCGLSAFQTRRAADRREAYRRENRERQERLRLEKEQKEEQEEKAQQEKEHAEGPSAAQGNGAHEGTSGGSGGSGDEGGAPEAPEAAGAAGAADCGGGAAATDEGAGAGALGAYGGGGPGGGGGSASGGEDFSEAGLDAVLATLDAHVGRMFASLGNNALLVVATGQGDTASTHQQQEMKFKRQQRVDGLPAWSLADEEAYVKVLDTEIIGLCFCAVKHAHASKRVEAE